MGSDARLALDVPVRSSTTGDWIIESSPFGPDISDGAWHKVLLKLDPQFSGGVKGQVDGGEDQQLALDEPVDLGPFVQTAAQVTPLSVLFNNFTTLMVLGYSYLRIGIQMETKITGQIGKQWARIRLVEVCN